MSASTTLAILEFFQEMFNHSDAQEYDPAICELLKLIARDLGVPVPDVEPSPWRSKTYGGDSFETYYNLCDSMIQRLRAERDAAQSGGVA